MLFLSGMALAADPIRVATYHTELSRDGPGLLLRDILSGKDEQVEALIRVIMHADVDILVLADIDYDMNNAALDALSNRLGSHPYNFSRRPNRGRPSGADIDRDGQIGGSGDAYGYAEYQGQGGLAILSNLPIEKDAILDLTSFRWADLPEAELPAGTPYDHPLSTTAHWDVPIKAPGGVLIHLLVWHATPPVFDGPEDRNGKRNHDETALWLAYIEDRLPWSAPNHFVLAGVGNLDPIDGDGRPDTLLTLLSHPKVNDVEPHSSGGVAMANADHSGDPALDTADWPDGPGRPGNLRVDYVLPSANLDVSGAGVLWPLPSSSLGRDVERASRHRLVWVDIELPDGVGQGG